MPRNHLRQAGSARVHTESIAVSEQTGLRGQATQAARCGAPRRPVDDPMTLATLRCPQAARKLVWQPRGACTSTPAPAPHQLAIQGNRQPSAPQCCLGPCGGHAPPRLHAWRNALTCNVDAAPYGREPEGLGPGRVASGRGARADGCPPPSDCRVGSPVGEGCTGDFSGLHEAGRPSCTRIAHATAAARQSAMQ